jgi:endonuclease/exonuclease/phosphatase family metal-dependent hydrolase
MADGWKVERPANEDPDAAKFQKLIAQLPASGWPPLLPRAMVAAAEPAAPTSADATTFTAMQFNLLAEGLSSPPHVKPPFAAKTQSAYGGLSAVPDPEVNFDWKVRKLRLLEEVLRYTPDVLVVEECDHFDDFLLPALRRVGYDGCFAPKRNSPSLSVFGFYSDGTGILWRTASFTQVATECEYLPNPDGSASARPYVLAALQPTVTAAAGSAAAPLMVAGTHLSAAFSDDAEVERSGQMTHLLNLVSERAASWGCRGVLLCGDLNTDPFDRPARGPARCVPAMLSHALGLRSSYALPPNEHEGLWTSWKKRGEDEIKCCIDYIVHNSALCTTRVLTPPDASELEPARLPGRRYPSDHISLLAELIIVPHEHAAA